VLALAPLLVPLVTALLTALAASRPRAQRALSFAGSFTFLAAAALLLERVHAGQTLRIAFGGWPAEHGIVFAVDRLGGLMVFVTALMGFATLLYAESDVDAPRRAPYLAPLVHGLLAGVAASFATADLFNLYVWFELMLVCAAGLLVLGGRLRQLDGALKYLALNLLGTLLLLVGVGMVYGLTGRLAFDELRSASEHVAAGPLSAAFGLLVFALLLKSGAFPLFSWLPAGYPTLPAPLLALFAGLLTKVGAYAILRLAADVIPRAPMLYDGAFATALGWIAAATMLTGVLGAAYHWDLRRILAFHIVSQIGYILLAIALGTTAGASAAIFYTVHHIVVKANLFLIAGLIASTTGSYDLRRSGGVLAARPWLAALFAVPALSLVGIPPFSGFWAKWLVLRESFALGRYAWAVVALLVSALTLYSVAKVWLEAFWKPRPEQLESNASAQPRAARPALAACALLGLVTLALSFAPQTLAEFADAAASALRAGGTP
jgi:multicomponent Na+:H+ antiporter subunit D